jgi:RNA polymerase sigma-70 factor (ECF subfamily)
MSDSPTHDASLKELAARLARGEGAAFAELYDACADRLHGYLAARFGSRDAASDVLQSAFLRAVKSRRRFRGVENPVAYMFQIARNEAARMARKRPSATPWSAVAESVAEPFTNTIHDPGDAEAIAAAIARLEPDDQELVELKIHAGLTFREIGAIVDRPPATVATRYRRAIETLRGWLTKEFR